MGSNLCFDLYTGPAWLSAALGLTNMLLLTPYVFTEFNIAKKEGEMMAARAQKKADSDGTAVLPTKKPDLVALIAIIIVSASIQFNFIFLET